MIFPLNDNNASTNSIGNMPKPIPSSTNLCNIITLLPLENPLLESNP